MKYTCFALDFDNCLAYHKDGRERLLKMFTALGFDYSTVKRAYRDAVDDANLSVNAIASAIERETGRQIDQSGLQDKFDEWISSAPTLFPDVSAFLGTLESLKIPTAIVTYGRPDLQQKKVDLADIKYDKIFITDEVGKKFTVLKNLLDTYGAPIAFVDDRPDELDNAREQFGENEVRTFRIIRGTGRHDDEPQKFGHPIVHSVLEIPIE